MLELQRKRQPRPLAFGSIAHKMKETMASGGDAFTVLDELPREDLEAYMDDFEHYGDILQDLKYIFEAYNEYWKGKELIYLPYKKKRAEFPFEVDLPKEDLLVKGTIDAVTSHRKFNWLTEHKNHRTIPDDDERWRSVQSVVYLKVIETLGWWKNIEGTCWDYIRTKAPSRPEINKDGSLSKRKIDTLPNVIRDVLKGHRYEHIRNSEAYKSLVDAARLNMPTYFQRVYTPVKKQLTKYVWDEFISTAREMRDYMETPREPVMTIGRHCSWCQFEPLCRAKLTGGDVDFLIEHDYKPSDYGARNEEATSED